MFRTKTHPIWANAFVALALLLPYRVYAAPTVSVSSPTVKSADPQTVLEAGEISESKVAKILSDERLWCGTLPGENPLKWLKMARNINSLKIVEIVLPNIEFFDKFKLDHMYGDNEGFPVLGIIVDNGISSVPLLVAGIRNSMWEPRGRKLALLALREIYAKGGFGDAMCRARLEAELVNADPVVRDRLLQTLTVFSEILDTEIAERARVSNAYPGRH